MHGTDVPGVRTNPGSEGDSMIADTHPLHLTGPWRKSTKSASGGCVEAAPAERRPHAGEASVRPAGTTATHPGE